jgi:hypothetical protein
MSVKKGLYYNINKRRKEGKSPRSRVRKVTQRLRRSNDLHAQPSVKVNPPPLSHRVDPAVFLTRRVFFMKR